LLLTVSLFCIASETNDQKSIWSDPEINATLFFSAVQLLVN